MNQVRCFAIVLPIAFAALGCAREESTRIVDPPPESRIEVAEAHWVTDRDALAGAVQKAAASPLVRRALIGGPNPRLTPLHQLAVRAVGVLRDGATVGVTILPYMVDGDSSHATFISLIDGGAVQIADVGDLIAGREPTALETGFIPVNLGGRIGWVKGVTSYSAALDGTPRLSPERLKWTKFVECLLGGAAAACESGADIADTIAPGVPRARAIGCGVGVAALAVGCAAQHLRP